MALELLQQQRPTPSLLVTDDDQSLGELLEGLGGGQESWK